MRPFNYSAELIALSDAFANFKRAHKARFPNKRGQALIRMEKAIVTGELEVGFYKPGPPVPKLLKTGETILEDGGRVCFVMAPDLSAYSDVASLLKAKPVLRGPLRDFEGETPCVNKAEFDEWCKTHGLKGPPVQTSRRQPRRATAQKAIMALYQGDAPDTLENKQLVADVNDWLNKEGFIGVSAETVLRAAGRRS